MALNPTFHLKIKDGVSFDRVPLHKESGWLSNEKLNLFEEFRISKNDTFLVDGIKFSDVLSTTQKHWLDGTVPTLDIYVWNPNEPSPSGYRHTVGPPAFMQNASSGGIIDFGQQNLSPGTGQTRVVTLKVNPTSGIIGISNIRLWQSASGINDPEDLTINLLATSVWNQGFALPSGNILQRTLPASQNIFRWDGATYIDGANTDGTFVEGDRNTSQFCYLSINTATSYGIGQYGPNATPDTNVKMRFSYDYYFGGRGSDAVGKT